MTISTCKQVAVTLYSFLRNFNLPTSFISVYWIGIQHATLISRKTCFKSKHFCLIMFTLHLYINDKMKYFVIIYVQFNFLTIKLIFGIFFSFKKGGSLLNHPADPCIFLFRGEGGGVIPTMWSQQRCFWWYLFSSAEILT